MSRTGLEDRYFVRKRYDVDGKHDDCRYFVLDPQHDQFARAALAVYADLAHIAGHESLAADIERWIDSLPPEASVSA